MLHEALQRRTAIVAAALLIAGCSGKTPTAPTPTTPSTTVAPAATVSSVSVNGNTPALGSTSQFVATATLSDGTTQNVTSQARWSSSVSSVATVSSGGIVTSVSAGQTEITATYQSLSGGTRVMVTRGAFNPQYEYQEQVSMADRRVVEDGIAAAQHDFMNQFGRGVEGALPVKVMATTDCLDGVSAGGAFGATRIQICTGNTTWTSAIQNFKTMAHEMFHIMQAQNRWPGYSNAFWTVEGGAEYVGQAVMISAGLASYEEVRDCQMNGFIREGRPMELLSQIGPSTPSSYKVSWLAWHLLLAGMNGVGRMIGYVDGGDFQQVFGISQAELDARFTPYRQSLQISAAGDRACDRLYRR